MRDDLPVQLYTTKGGNLPCRNCWGSKIWDILNRHKKVISNNPWSKTTWV